MGLPAVDEINNTYGRLTVIERLGFNKQRQALWFCRCVCGKTATVSGTDLRRGKAKSCGCMSVKHGKSNTPEYRIFKAARNRCTNQAYSQYKDYGGRGIRFLFTDFEQFWSELGSRPDKSYSLERMDNEGDYKPGNVKWATRSEQESNKRKRLRLEQFSNTELKLECLKRGIDVHNSEYLGLTELLRLITCRPLRELYEHYAGKFLHATGSSHNHQAWVGGYIHHIVECLNIARWVYSTSPRPLPFTLPDALLVLFLHDIEKPFKGEFHWSTKEDRRDFREMLIQQNQIVLTEEQKNALRYVEGVPDSEYSNKERVMGPLAAFCHMCDVASARIWWYQGEGCKW